MNLSGSWAYRDSKSGNNENTEDYSAFVGKQVELTEIMDLDLGMRASRNKRETNTGENYSPSFGYHLTNDIFALHLTGYANQSHNSSRSDTLSRNVSALWSSAWIAKGWRPSLSLNHNKSMLEDDFSPHRNDSDASSSNASLNWDFDHTQFHYSYMTQESNNYAGSTQYLSDGHNARFTTGATFWEQKGRASFSSQYTTTDYENSLPVTGGIALLRLNVSSFFGEVTGTGFTLANSAGLTNGDKSDSIIVRNNFSPDYLTIAVRKNFIEQVDQIHLYIDSDETLSAADAANFSWEVYTSNDNSSWTLRETDATTTYDTGNKRFKIYLDGYSEDYVAIRSTNNPITVIFSEIEVFQEISSAGDRTVLEYDHTTITNELDLFLQIRPELQLTSNLALIHNDFSAAGNSRQTTVSNGLTWSPREYLSIRLNNSIMSRKIDGFDELQDRVYGFSVAMPPIKTVDTIFSVTMREEYRGSRKLAVTTNYNMQVLAELYTDLDARYTASYIRDDDKDDGTVTGTSSSDLDLIARLVPGLVGKVSGRYTKSTGQGATYGSSQDINWRISELVSLTSGFSQEWGYGEDSSVFDLSGHLAVTDNMQLSLTHRYRMQPYSREDTYLSWRWTINRYVSLLTSGIYANQSNGYEDWSVTSRLSASFSTP